MSKTLIVNLDTKLEGNILDVGKALELYNISNYIWRMR